ncbi:unnamed protein product [Peniophora sp. CBMAI 1063]|nr:unnamed protein product [Peniophora sp. CBMAI 1063]
MVWRGTLVRTADVGVDVCVIRKAGAGSSSDIGRWETSTRVHACPEQEQHRTSQRQYLLYGPTGMAIVSLGRDNNRYYARRPRNVNSASIHAHFCVKSTALVGCARENRT